MLDKLKADFEGILELVNKAPEPLRETAFKMILEGWFAANLTPPVSKKAAPGTAPGESPNPMAVPDVVKPFLTANGITTGILEKAFHPTGPGAQLLATEIDGAGRASKLVNLGVLLCVRKALDAGTFTCTLQELRQMAVHYDCYDSTNFSKTLTGNKNFKPRDKGADLDLSGPGLKKAAELIKAVAAE